MQYRGTIGTGAAVERPRELCNPNSMRAVTLFSSVSNASSSNEKVMGRAPNLQMSDWGPVVTATNLKYTGTADRMHPQFELAWNNRPDADEVPRWCCHS